MKRLPFLLGIISLCSLSLYTQEISTGRFNNLAIRGYDPVAYHLLGEPREGSKEYSLDWRGAEWRFISAEHRDLFRTDPQVYAPQFGGHCANGLSDGHKVNGDPRQWRIIDGKLYLFFSERGRESWEGDVTEKLSRARETWERLR